MLRVALAMIGTHPNYRLVRAGQKADGSPVSRLAILKDTDTTTNYARFKVNRTKNIDDLRKDVQKYFNRSKKQAPPPVGSFYKQNFDEALTALLAVQSLHTLEQHEGWVEYINSNFKRGNIKKGIVWSYDYSGELKPNVGTKREQLPTYKAWLAGNRR